MLNDSLIANANHFYFDYKDGKYGYNTSETRGADTFVPFSEGAEIHYSKHTGVTSITIPTTKKAKFIAVYAEIYAYGGVYSDGSYVEELNLSFGTGKISVTDNSFTYQQESGSALTYHVFYIM